MGAMSNDAIELYFANPSGAPLRIDPIRLGQMSKAIEDICQYICFTFQDANLLAKLQLTDVQHGSLRFRFNLEFEVNRDAVVQPKKADPSKPSKDTMTRSSEVLGILGFIFAVVGPTQAKAPPLDPVERADWEMAQTLIGQEHTSELIVRLRSQAARSGPEEVRIYVRGNSLALQLPEDIERATIASRSKDPLPIGETADAEITPTDDMVEVVLDGRVYSAVPARMVIRETDGNERWKRRHNVVVLWDVPGRHWSNAHTFEIRYRTLSPSDVRFASVIEPEFERMDGIILVTDARDYDQRADGHHREWMRAGDVKSTSVSDR